MAAKVDETRCVGCGGCIYLCPVGVLELIDMKCHVHEGCIDCGVCEDVCNWKAITVPDRTQAAS
jgi:NAD-dependent dihydropyrimidine dehydrogenase PreA subunit